MADPFQSNQAFTVQPSYPFSNYGQLSQYPTPCKEYRSLWCFILGDHEPFKVTLPLNIVVDVDDLKEVIHVKGIDTAKSKVLPKDLILWKARESELLEPHKTFVDRVSIKFSNLAEVATQLGASQTTSTLFPQQPPQGCLHIVVQMPPPDSGSAKRSMGADDDGHPPTKKLRTGDVVLDIEPSLPTGLNRPNYGGGRLTSLCTPFFPDMRLHLGRFLVDKTKLIEDIVEYRMGGIVDLVLRPRRCGKSTMLQMINSFFSDPQDGIDNINPHHLFSGLYIANKHKICQDHMGKYKVIFLDFQKISGPSWTVVLDSFKKMVSLLYEDWRDYLWDDLSAQNRKTFQSLIDEEASDATLRSSLALLSQFLAKKSGRKVIVLIDEYEAPNNRAYEYGFFEKADEFFGRGVLPALLKTNKHIAYGLLAGVTPTAKAGWYSGLNNIQKHPLHERMSVFAGKLMFTEAEVLKLRELSESDLDPKALKEHYNSYLAGGHLNVYNPVSIMSAFEKRQIKNYWIQTGEYPLLRRKIPANVSALDKIAALLCRKEVSFVLQESVTFSNSTLDINETLTLLYYAGYLTMTSRDSDRIKIPNREVMSDWAQWIVNNIGDKGDDLGTNKDIADECVTGPVNRFQQRWPEFMQHHLSPKSVAKDRSAKSPKTPERIYQVFLFALMLCLGAKGWEVTIKEPAGEGYTDFRLISKKTKSAVLIEVKSSEKAAHIQKDAKAGLKQIEAKNYGNSEGLQGVRVLREYGIGYYHLKSYVEGQYLELDTQGCWEKKADLGTL